MQELNKSDDESTSVPKTIEDSPPQLSKIFDGMSTISHDVNKIVSPRNVKNISFQQSTTVFENLRIMTGMQPPVDENLKRRKSRLRLDAGFGSLGYEPITPSDTMSRWNPPPITSISTRFIPYLPSQFSPLPVMNDDPMTDNELVKMKGPSRLIGFLVHIAMNEKARRALRWTGNGLEFVIVNKELVAKMWGNRKHNTKDMDYYKLSRAIREKYEKKTKNAKAGKLKKGTRTYSYIFTEHAYGDLINQTEQSIEAITHFASHIGQKYGDNSDLINSASPESLSAQND